MFNEYLISHYKHNMTPTCFGHSYGHPTGGALWRIYYKSVWTNAPK